MKQFEVKMSAVSGQRSADELSWKGSGGFNFSTNITLLRSLFHRTLNVQRRTFNIELLQSLVSSPKQKTKFFVRIRPGARKPAKVKAVGMQGVKERACELLLRPSSTRLLPADLKREADPLASDAVCIRSVGDWIERSQRGMPKLMC